MWVGWTLNVMHPVDCRAEVFEGPWLSPQHDSIEPVIPEAESIPFDYTTVIKTLSVRLAHSHQLGC
jgi:hypothetical protein